MLTKSAKIWTPFSNHFHKVWFRLLFFHEVSRLQFLAIFLKNWNRCGFQTLFNFQGEDWLGSGRTNSIIDFYFEDTTFLLDVSLVEVSLPFLLGSLTDWTWISASLIETFFVFNCFEKNEENSYFSCQKISHWKKNLLRFGWLVIKFSLSTLSSRFLNFITRLKISRRILKSWHSFEKCCKILTWKICWVALKRQLLLWFNKSTSKGSDVFSV